MPFKPRQVLDEYRVHAPVFHNSINFISARADVVIGGLTDDFKALLCRVAVGDNVQLCATRRGGIEGKTVDFLFFLLSRRPVNGIRLKRVTVRIS